MTTRTVRLNGLWIAAFLWGCFGDSTGIGNRLSPEGMIVSDPAQPAATAQGSGSLSAGFVGDGSVYVSLPPGTVPGGNFARIRNQRTGGMEMALLVAGGFDPVTIAASPGDTLDVDVELFEPGAPVHIVIPVPLTRQPVVVRTDPPPRKRDVPLNAAVVIVFSEPIDSTTLTSTSVQLLDGSTRVPTHLDPRDSAHVKTFLVPDAPLAPNVTYTLVVTRAVRDLSGDALEAPLSVTFTTAASASVRSQIAFHQLEGGGGTPAGIYAINPDGTGATLLVNDFNDGTGEPAWSPDGRRLAFVSRRHQLYGSPGDLAVYVMNADGSGLARLTNSPAPDEWPAWSPDGTKIAFNRFTCMNPDCTQQGYRAVYTVNVDGTGLTRLTDPVGVGNDGRPTWSPDGKRIAFVRSTDSTGSDVYVMNANGSNLVRLTDGHYAVATPAWSPDGSRIAYGRAPYSTGNPDLDIYIMNADGSNVRQVTSGPSADFFPSWSPDGQRLVFYSEGRDPVQAIFIIGADGSGLTRVTDDPYGVTTPSWSRAPSP
jgi:TolB protein